MTEPPGEFLESRGGHQGEMRKRLRDKNVIVVDVRPPEEFDAGGYLSGKGYDAKLLHEGLPDWASAGLPIERS